MIRLLLPLFLALVVYAGLRWYAEQRAWSARVFWLTWVALLAGGTLVLLGLTGRLHWLAVLVGAALPFLARLVNLAGIAFSLHQRVKGGIPGAGRSGGTATPPDTSEISTAWVRVVLDHGSGEMDGEILAGHLAGRSLGSLTRAETEQLLASAGADPDSARLLEAWLGRMHPEWLERADGDSGDAESEFAGSGSLTLQQARDVLGLDETSTEADVVAAHRRLIQKVHPDRGGSTWLAARINQAKDVLVAALRSRS